MMIDKEMNMYRFTLYPNPEFDFDLLPLATSEWDVEFSVLFDEGYVIEFSSDSLDRLDEVRDELSFLEMTEVEFV